MGGRIVGTAWRIRHTYGRRPLSTFAVTIAAVIALRLSLLAARRAGGTCPSSPGLARVGPVGSAQHSDLVTLAVADEPPPRRKMLVLLCAGVAGAWLLRTRIRERRGLDDQWRYLPAAPRPVPTATPASAAVTTGASSSAAPNPVTNEPVNPTAGPGTGPVTAMPPAPAPSDIPSPQAATEPEPEPEPTATPDHPVTPAATTLAPTHPDAAEPTPLTPAAPQPAPPEPTPDQPANAPQRTRSDAVPAASAQASVTPVTPVTPAVRADAPFGPGSVRAQSDGSSPDPAYVVKGKTATKAFYTPPRPTTRAPAPMSGSAPPPMHVRPGSPSGRPADTADRRPAPPDDRPAGLSGCAAAVLAERTGLRAGGRRRWPEQNAHRPRRPRGPLTCFAGSFQRLVQTLLRAVVLAAAVLRPLPP